MDRKSKLGVGNSTHTHNGMEVSLSEEISTSLISVPKDGYFDSHHPSID